MKLLFLSSKDIFNIRKGGEKASFWENLASNPSLYSHLRLGLSLGEGRKGIHEENSELLKFTEYFRRKTLFRLQFEYVLSQSYEYTLPENLLSI